MDFDFKNHILHHMNDTYQWHLPFPFVPPINLPEPITLHALMLLFGAFLVILTFCFIYRKNDRVPRGFTNLLESLIIFIRDDIAIGCLGEEEGPRFTPYLCSLFFFILILNVLGLIPIFAPATSNINITGALASVTFIFMVFGAIRKNGFKGFLKTFVPSGMPLPILFIVVPLEFMGLFIKSFALMIRLFANMLGGHIAIASLLGLIIVLGIYTLPILLLAVFIYMLEILVVFIQAYVFTFLSAIFIAQTFHPEH